jgi:hypothetical protein
VSPDARRPAAGRLQRGAAVPRRFDIVAEISAPDPYGGERNGLVVSMPRWEPWGAGEPESLGADFLIVLLQEPARALEPVPASTVLCVPARPLERPATLREAATEYVAGTRSGAETGAAQAELLAHGTLVSQVELEITPRQAFAGGEPRFDELARDLLFGQALADTFAAISVALAAPAPPEPREHPAVIRALRDLVAAARKSHEAEPDAAPAASEALERLSQVAGPDQPRACLVAAGRAYSSPLALLEEVYLLRSLADDPLRTADILRMRAYVDAASAPGNDTELSLDRAIADEQLRFFSLVPEPSRLATAIIAFENFRASYLRRYEEHHRMYWRDVDRVHDLLLNGSARARALHRLNSLTELGPPIGARALERYTELLKEAAGCSFADNLPAALAESAVCPGCGIRLGDSLPHEPAEEALSRIERAIGRQLARLSSVAVSRLLESSDDPGVERFLKVVQASQVSSLPEVLDDDVVGYLRRFLVEARISSVLEPLLDAVQHGAPPTQEEAGEAVREMAGVIELAFRAAGHSLPGPKGEQRGDSSPIS